MAYIFENAVITQKGQLLQSKLVTGGTLSFTNAKTGAGTVAVEDLVSQTSVTQIKQTLQFTTRPTYREDGTVRLKFSVKNDGVTTGYDMHQIGLYATDPQDGEILYALLQSSTPISVPSESELDGFTVEFNVGVTYSNADTVTVVVDPAGVEYEANKVFEINDENREDNDKYPSVKAVADAIDEITANDVGALPIVPTVIGVQTDDELKERLSSFVDDAQDRSINYIRLSISATDSPIGRNIYYGLLFKHTQTYATLHVQDATGNVYYRFFQNGTWGSWTTKFLPLSGGTLTGELNGRTAKFTNGLSTIREFGTSDIVETNLYPSNYSWDGERVSTVILKKNNADKAMLFFNEFVVGFRDTVNSVAYRLFSEKNKPTGTYVGNGSATAITVHTGGIGNVCFITGSYGTKCIICEKGGWYAQGSAMIPFAAEVAYFAGGHLYLKTNVVQLNGSGYTYSYQVL